MTAAPTLVERVPVASGPVGLPELGRVSLVRGWPLVAAVAGLVDVALIVVAVVVL